MLLGRKKKQHELSNKFIHEAVASFKMLASVHELYETCSRYVLHVLRSTFVVLLSVNVPQSLRYHAYGVSFFKIPKDDVCSSN